MGVTPEQHRENVIFEKKVQQVIETLNEIFGFCSISVVLQAVANWIGIVVFNFCSTCQQRRELVERFAKQIEEAITNCEKGQSLTVGQDEGKKGN